MRQRRFHGTRRDGDAAAFGRMKLDELREARLELLQRDLGEPGTRALFDAVNAAIEGYRAAGATPPEPWLEAA